MTGLTRSPSVMDHEPAAQLLWRSTATRVERRATLSEGRLSMSLRVEEVSMVALAVADATPSIGPDSCPELELGAHVARMHMAAPTVSDASSEGSLLSGALAPA
jgi:hypothetical protein